MFRLGRSRPVAERQATGEVRLVYHQIKETLRVSGVNLLFRTWAGSPGLLPILWGAVAPNAETRALEDAADDVRALSVRLGEPLGRLGAAEAARLGEAQVYRLRGLLELYHYINPKLLLLSAAIRLALEGERVGGRGNGGSVELVARGAPAGMAAMDMVEERPGDPRIEAIFADIQRTFALPSINSDYRSLALFPDYLAAAWERLAPLSAGEPYKAAVRELGGRARELARALPRPVAIPRDALAERGLDPDDVRSSAATFERILAPLVLNISLLGLDFQAPEDLARPPFPAPSRRAVVAQEVAA